ncbi:MAG: glutaminyl-peptide cyclotransferase [Syntrophobacteraceae bacterium]|jgi:glutaminyl-peptide cyclotransferase
MAANLRFKCAVVLFSVLANLFSAISLHEISPVTDRVLCIQSALAMDAETEPLSSPQPHLAPLFKIRILKRYPHDPSAFTQGLIFANGFLYESTGLNGESSLRQVELETGRVLKKYDLPFRYFGEGLTLWKGSLFQLTWKSRKGFVYDLDSFAVKREFSYSGEGWGLATVGKSLVMSNGTEDLIFLNPKTLVRQRSLRVLDMGNPVPLLNELEFIKGEIFANVWHDDFVAKISPKTGKVTGWIDMSALRQELPPESNPEEALNGIAYDAEKDRIFVTGKLWPLLFEIEVIQQ